MRHSYSKTVAQDFADTYKDKSGAIRWVSSDNVPPMEILTEFLIAGFIEQDEVIVSANANKADEAKFLKQYVEARKKNGYSDEEKFEMRAAFGGEQVVDIFTGKVVNY